ncbi:MFS transporter [Micromonospora cathayae]|uniref:MFS transporter n=1 Tax=Micromonospora cathayae TaxID=3028804 RepID=A0ABY7ZKK2_9ACTN|nr:MFS transporter [Micromonospora sp. HUAS 3]WDZ83296.1 MFS transporter [Micromonospora sp. HUAS 3]
MTAISVSPGPASTGRRAVLRDPAFLRLWTGTTASGLGTWALPFVLGLAVLDRRLSGVGLGLVLAARTVGFLVAVPVGGVLADRLSRRRVVLWSGLAAASASPVLAVAMGRSTVVMALAAAVMGAGQGACRPAFQALTAEVVTEDRRQRANAAITLAVRVTTLVAPALVALLATVVEVGSLLFGIGVLWLLAALVPPPGRGRPGRATPGHDQAERTTPERATSERATPVGRASRAGFVAEFTDGLREARRHPWFLGGLGALTAVIATGYSATGVLLPLVSRDRYGTEAVLAAVLTGYAVGALAGAVLVARWQPAARGWGALAGLAAYAFAPLSLLLDVPAVVLVTAYVLAGVGIELFNVPWFTAIQREVHPDRLARVSSLDFLLSYGLAPVGLALVAPAADAFGAPVVLGCCALVCLVAPVLAARVPGARDFSRPTPAPTPTPTPTPTRSRDDAAAGPGTAGPGATGTARRR